MEALDELTWHVMDAMADDWESIVQIRPHVFQYCGPTSDDTIFQTLLRLHEAECIEIMDEEGQGTSVFPDDPKGCWFSMTKRGRSLWNSEGSKYRN
jgi:hypothetical protein